MLTEPAPPPRCRGAEEILADAQARTRSPLRAAVAELPTGMRHLVGYHFGWWDEHGAPIDGKPGKAVRPALVLLSCAAVGGAPVPALPAAVAVELVHNASLLHDDVIDEDRVRRHRPTTWAAFGRPAAILSGDALFFLASQVLLTAGEPLSSTGMAGLNQAVQTLTEGEYNDTVLPQRTDPTVAECLAVAADKTGALLGLSCALGALAGGADEAQVEHFRSYGQRLGLAFQLVDDLLGLVGDPARTGKPAQSDLSTKRRTLPVVAALAAGGPAARELAGLLAGPGDLTPAETTRAARLVQDAGGADWARQEARRQIDAALADLGTAAADPTAAAELATLADLIRLRDR